MWLEHSSHLLSVFEDMVSLREQIVILFSMRCIAGFLKTVGMKEGGLQPLGAAQVSWSFQILRLRSCL